MRTAAAGAKRPRAPGSASEAAGGPEQPGSKAHKGPAAGSVASSGRAVSANGGKRASAADVDWDDLDPDHKA